MNRIFQITLCGTKVSVGQTGESKQAKKHKWRERKKDWEERESNLDRTNPM